MYDQHRQDDGQKNNKCNLAGLQLALRNVRMAISKLLLVFALFTFSFGFRFPFGNSKKIGKTNELESTKLYFSNEKIGPDGNVHTDFSVWDDYFGVTGEVLIESLPTLNGTATVDDETYHVFPISYFDALKTTKALND
ncbi:MAG: hypothetical protein EZS28_046281, partial [Streblomastix strix]